MRNELIFLPPTKVLTLSFVGAEFWVLAKLDKTTLQHFIEGLAWYALFILFQFPWYACALASILAVSRAEINDGVTVERCIKDGCAQGFDFLDWGASVLAIAIVYFLF